MSDLEHDIAVIREWAASSPIVIRVWLFGSRVKGTHRPDSDLYVAIEHGALPGDEDASVTAFDRDKWCAEIQRKARLKLDVLSYIPGVDTTILEPALAEASKLVYER